MQQKQAHCPLCSTFSTLYQLPDGQWACKDGRPGFTCYEMWEKQHKKPITYTVKDL